MEINGEKLLKESDSSIRNEKRKTKTHAGIFKQGIQLFSIFSEEMLINCLIKKHLNVLKSTKIFCFNYGHCALCLLKDLILNLKTTQVKTNS